MFAFNSFIHGTQDLYPTFLQKNHRFSPQTVGLIAIIYNIGALLGGIFWHMVRADRPPQGHRDCRCFVHSGHSAVGLFQQCRAGGARSFSSMQFMVQGAWGAVPAHLNELSPPGVRGTFPGFAYQFGNFLSSRNAVIQAKLVEHRYGGSFAPVLAATVHDLPRWLPSSPGADVRKEAQTFQIQARGSYAQLPRFGPKQPISSHRNWAFYQNLRLKFDGAESERATRHDFSAFSRRRCARSRSCSPKMIAIGFTLIFVKRRLPFSSITPSTATSIPGYPISTRSPCLGMSRHNNWPRQPAESVLESRNRARRRLQVAREFDKARCAVLQFDETAIMLMPLRAGVVVVFRLHAGLLFASLTVSQWRVCQVVSGMCVTCPETSFVNTVARK